MPLNMANSTRPSYATLQEQVFASFTAPADFMPATLTYWYFSADDALTRTTVEPARFAAHPVTKLAHTAERGEDLPLVLPYTPKGAPGISVCRAEWDAAGIFEVDYCQAESYKEELCFTTSAFLKFQVKWGDQICYNIVSDFHQNGTSVNQSDCVQAADVFLEFLNFEFGVPCSPR